MPVPEENEPRKQSPDEVGAEEPAMGEGGVAHGRMRPPGRTLREVMESARARQQRPTEDQGR